MILTVRVRAELRRIVLFVGAGLVNTAFGFGVYALAAWLGLTPALAVLVSTMAGVAFNYRTLGAVFAAREYDQLPRFIIVYSALVPLNVVLLRAAQHAGADPYLGEALALAVVVPLTYLALRLFVFPTPRPVGPCDARSRRFALVRSARMRWPHRRH